jgi:hypothetical protein
MKNVRIPLTVVMVLALTMVSGCARTPVMLDSRSADLDRDGAVETVGITCRSREGGHPMGGDIVVERSGKVIWRQKRLNPWKLRLADVDGDGRQEIVLGVWKKSPKDPVMAKRVFVYGWNGKRMMPKWLGSRLSRRFVDFDVLQMDGDGVPELIALEVAPGKPRRIGVYRWRSFGFDWVRAEKPNRWRELVR